MDEQKKKEKANHGGKRAKAGRKKVSDPKVGVTIYVHQSVINANGGTEEVKQAAVDYLQKRGKKSGKRSNHR